MEITEFEIEDVITTSVKGTTEELEEEEFIWK